jgi:hypothetical protein
MEGAWLNKEDDPDIIGRIVNVRKIELGGMRIISRDKKNEYLYVPVWSFFGDVTSRYAFGKGDVNQLNDKGEFTDRQLFQCVLTINAIDGSIINRAQGY